MNAYEKWLRTFFEEKDLEEVEYYFEIEGNPVVTNNKDAIEVLANLKDKASQEAVKRKIVQIDFVNGDINHFLEYVIKGHMMNVIKGM